MLKVVAPMAGITDASFLNKVIPYGFNVATLGGYSLDSPTLEASKKIVQRGRKEFDIPLDNIFNHIENEVNLIKNTHNHVKVSANVRSTNPQPIIDVGNIKNLDIVEINCHCRQNEILAIGCGQEMLKRDDEVSKNEKYDRTKDTYVLVDSDGNRIGVRNGSRKD